MSGVPERLGQLGRSWGHPLRAVEGRFRKLVWECPSCGVIRTEKEFYRTIECASMGPEGVSSRTGRETGPGGR